MKILYVITRSDVVGGASVHLLDLAEGVKSLGHQVLILVGGGGIFVDFAKERGLNVRPLRHLVRKISPIKDILALSEILRVIVDFEPDVVHLHSSKAGVLGRLAARIRGVPAVFTVHGWAFTDGVSSAAKFFYTGIERCLARISSQIILVSNFDRDLALRCGVGVPDLLLTIHNGVVDLSPNELKKELGPRVRLIMVARFDEQKDHLLLVRALASIKDLPWELEFVGDGPLQAQCRQLVAQLGLARRVAFSGFCNDVHCRIAESDVLVLSSKWEGLPLTIIEAMRGGLPVVASNVGGVSELVLDGVTGFLAKRNDEAAMTTSLRAVLEAEDRRNSMGVAARLRYEQNFSFEKMRDKTMAVYQAVLPEVA